MTAKIRILLCDDNPFCYDADLLHDVDLPKQYASHFEVSWIQNAQEGRFLLDAFELLSAQAPESLTHARLPPEIEIFDYALTKGGDYQRTDLQSSNVLPMLQQLLDKHEIRVSAPTAILPYGPKTGSPLQADRTGCYLGGELARSFAMYPCGAVPTTATISTEKTDAAFYEWLNERFFQNRFKEKSRGAPQWPELINAGVRCLRARVEELTAAGLVRIDFETLCSLMDHPITARSATLTWHTRFGSRILPIAGLFAETLLPEVPDETAFARDARAWASRLLQSLLGSHNMNEFREASQLAEIYYKKAFSEVSNDRYELSELAGMASHTKEQKEQFKLLCEIYQVDAKLALTDPGSVTVSKESLPYWRKAASSEHVARWVALMLTVRAEQKAHQPVSSYLKGALNKCADSFERTGTDRFAMNDLRAILSSEIAKDQKIIQKMIGEGVLSKVTKNGETTFQITGFHFATENDVYKMLDPAPETLFTFLQNQSGYLSNYLKRLGHHKDGPGPLRLKVADLLRNRPFNGIDQFGLRPGEGKLLQIYADSCGFASSRWPSWLSNAH